MNEYIIKKGSSWSTRVFKVDLQSAQDYADSLGAGYIAEYYGPAMSPADIYTIEDLLLYGTVYNKDFKASRDDLKQYVKGLPVIITGENDPSTLSPIEGDNYLIGELAVGDWSGKEGQVATWESGSWVYFVGDGYADAVERKGFSLLPSENHIIAATCLIGTVGQQIAAFNDQEKKTLAQGEYKRLVQECRQNRYKDVENYVLQHIPANAGEVLLTILSSSLHFMYRDQGIDGIVFGDPVPGLGDYVLGTGPYAGIGLKDKPWITLYGVNMVDFSAILADKLFYKGI